MSSSCPQCGAPVVVPIVYGLPGQELLGAAEQRLVVLGGCSLLEGAPCWRCMKCQHEWGTLEEAEGADYREAVERAVSAHRPLSPEERRARMYQRQVQPVLDRVLPAAAAEGAECLVIEYVAGSSRWEEGPNTLLVREGRRELIDDGELSRYILNGLIPHEGAGPEQSIRVRVQGQDVVLGIKRVRKDQRVRITLRLEALAGLKLAPVAPLARRASCRYCGGPLRTPRSAQCFSCGMDWHDPNNVVNNRSRR